MCKSGKTSYPCAHKARMAFVKAKERRNVRDMHPYRCAHCGDWHNTSEPKEYPHEIKARHQKFNNSLKRRAQREAINSQAD